MKSLEELYKEVQMDETLKTEFISAFKEGHIEAFFSSHDCDASASDVNEFLHGQDMEALSDDDLDNLAVEKTTKEQILMCFDANDNPDAPTMFE